MATDLLIARILHILGAIVWVGGTVFLAAVAIPFARTLPPEQRVATIAGIGRRFRPIGWCALLLLVGSGLYTMLRFELLSWSRLTGSGYGRLLLVKLFLVLTIVVLTGIHDFVLGPRSQSVPRSTVLAVARTSGLLTIAVPIVGVILAH
ncbi:MAG: CopD family protein [Actinomycetota bacterium]